MAGRAYGKTVWSWPSLPRSSLSRRCERAQPGRLHHPNSRGEGGQKNGRLPGDHGISRPATAQGRPSDRRHLYAAVRSFLRVPFAQQTAGASRHPAFPVPSWIQRVARPAKARANCAARLKRHVCHYAGGCRRPASAQLRTTTGPSAALENELSPHIQ